MTPLPPPPIEPPAATAERRAAALERVGLLELLGPHLLRIVAAESAERVYAAGEQVIRQGDPGASMFVILSGRVEVTVREAAGPPLRLAELTAGDYFGEMSLMTGAPRVATVTALEETPVLEVSKEIFGRALEARPDLVDELGRALHLRMAERAQAVAGVAPTGPEVQDIFRKIRDFFSL
jgi:CRP-like cAMP-binding protein